MLAVETFAVLVLEDAFVVSFDVVAFVDSLEDALVVEAFAVDVLLLFDEVDDSFDDSLVVDVFDAVSFTMIGVIPVLFFAVLFDASVVEVFVF